MRAGLRVVVLLSRWSIGVSRSEVSSRSWRRPLRLTHGRWLRPREFGSEYSSSVFNDVARRAVGECVFPDTPAWYIDN